MGRLKSEESRPVRVAYEMKRGANAAASSKVGENVRATPLTTNDGTADSLSVLRRWPDEDTTDEDDDGNGVHDQFTDCFMYISNIYLFSGSIIAYKTFCLSCLLPL